MRSLTVYSFARGVAAETAPACRLCGVELVECPRGDSCIGTSEWRISTVCECLRGLICPTHGPLWAPAR